MAHHAITPYWLYRATRPLRLRRAQRRYAGHFARLGRIHAPGLRAGELEVLAGYASRIAGIGPGGIEAENDWAARAEILRAVAATERFCVLTDAWDYGEEGPRVTGPGEEAAWLTLACAAAKGARLTRALTLRALADRWDGTPGAAVLADIAAAEETLAAPAGAPASTRVVLWGSAALIIAAFAAAGASVAARSAPVLIAASAGEIAAIAVFLAAWRHLGRS